MKYQLLITYYRQQTTPKLVDRRYSLRLLFTLLLVGLGSTGINAQINVGAITPPDASAILQATSNNKGVLFPNLSATQRDAIANPAAGLVIFNTTANQLQYNAGTAANKNWQPVGNVSGQQLPLVSLTNTLLPAPLATHIKGVAVYNTATTGSGTTGVIPGIYINDGTQWRAAVLAPAVSFVATFMAGSLVCTGALAGTYTASMAMAATNTKTVTITATAIGPYTASTDTQNGVSFLASGNITAMGSNIVILTASGTPTTSGTFTYTVTVAGQTCTFNVVYALPVATFSAGTIDCGGTLAGTYVATVAATATNTKIVNITAATLGTYTANSNTQNGISFSATGTITAIGSNAITFTASGTPTTSGMFTYTATIGGQTCTFSVTYAAPIAINCSGALSGSYIPNVAMTAANTKVVNATVLVAGTYTITTDTQNGVSFSAPPTALAVGTTAVTLTATGTPTSTSLSSFTASVGGQTCSFSVFFLPYATFTAGTINCSGTLAGTYTAYKAMDATNTKTIRITIATGGNFSGSTDIQNGVSFSATGVYGGTGVANINFTASGTPTTGGTFTYTVSFGGQICTFAVTYALPVATFTAGSIDCSGTLAGTYNAFTAMTVSNTKTIAITAASVGTYTASTTTQNGVSFLATGTIAATGSANIILVAGGTPTAGGSFTYTVTIAGQTCTFTIVYAVPIATFTVASLNCTGALAGIYSAFTAMTATNTKTIVITVASIGTYTASTNTQNGVKFSATGTIAATGSVNIVLVASGSPSADGSFTYTVTIAGQTCTFDILYQAHFNLAASSVYSQSGEYVPTIPMTAANFETFLLRSDGGGAFTATSDLQNGVSFLGAGTAFANTSAYFDMAANGTPISAGTFTYTVAINNITITFTVTYATPVAHFQDGFNCGGALSGNYIVSTVMDITNTKAVSATVATIGTYTVTTDVQNGVSFSVSDIAKNTGNLAITLKATGTPTATGTFTYTALLSDGIIPGGQSCTFTITYIQPPALYTAGTIDCSGILSGNYVVNTPMTQSNTKAVKIGVTTTGSYNLVTNTQNGVYFSAVGNVSATGLNTIALAATGTPTTSGAFTYFVTIGGQTCSFTVTYVAAFATFTTNTLVCSGALSGQYAKGVAMNANNTKFVTITGATAGAYSASTNVQNGVSFSANGVATTGSNTITLVATGTPINTVTSTYTVTIAGQTCTFSVAPSVATFTAGSLSCAGALSGGYFYNFPLNTTNTKVITINATTIGTYTIKTADDGFDDVAFSATGVITTLGINNITLVGSGTSGTYDVVTYPLTLAGQTCSFDVYYSANIASINCNTGTAATGFYTASVPLTGANTKNVVVTITDPGVFTLTTPVVNGVSFTGSAFSNGGGDVQNIALAANGTPLAAGAFTYTVTDGLRTCTFTVTYATPATFTAGTLDCSGALAGNYFTSTNMAATNTKTLAITATAIGGFGASTDTQNNVTFFAAGNITATGANTVTLVASGNPVQTGTYTYTVSLAGQQCSFSVTYIPAYARFTAGTFSCGGVLAGNFNVGVPMAATNTKAVTASVITSGSFIANTNTLNGVNFSSSNIVFSATSPTLLMVASGTPLAAGTFIYTDTLRDLTGNQTCTFSVVFVQLATFTAGTLACTGTLAGNYNAGVAMAATNKKTVTITAATTGSYSASTNTLNGVSFSLNGTTEGAGSMTVAMVASGTPLAAGIFTYTTTIAGQTCTFDVVFANDKLRAAFSSVGCASCTAYDAAAVNTWVPVTAAEYAALASTTNVASAAVYGTTEANMTSGTAAYPSSTGNQTTLALQLPTVANTYLYALSMEVATSTANQGFQVKAVPVATPTTTITNVPSTGVFATIVTAIAARTRVYFVLKQPTTAVAAASYVGGWPPTNMALQYGPLLGAANARYYGAGNVTTGLALAANSFRVQLLGTVTKQW